MDEDFYVFTESFKVQDRALCEKMCKIFKLYNNM